jgi:hypothetical protein
MKMEDVLLVYKEVELKLKCEMNFNGNIIPQDEILEF